MDPRTLRAHRRSRRDYMREYRAKKTASIRTGLQFANIEIINLDKQEPSEPPCFISPRSRASIKRERKKLIDKYVTVSQQNMKLRKNLNTFRSRLRRERMRNPCMNLNNESTQSEDASPTRENVNSTLSCTRKTKHAVTAYFSLLNQIKRKYRMRRFLASSIHHVWVKHSGTQLSFTNALQCHSSTIRKGLLSINRSKKVEQNVISLFFCRDDNSRLTAGKKETITRNKIKMQVGLQIECLFF